MQEVFEKQPRAIVLLDMKLEDATGLDVLAVLKKTNPSAVVIQMSGYPEMSELMKKGIEMSAFTSLTKPFEPDQLFHTLEQAMGIKRKSS